MTNLEFVSTFIGDAEEAGDALGIALTIPLAQMLLESGSGTSFISKVYHNFAGMENPPGSKTIFEIFPNIQDFVIAYIQLMKKDCPALSNPSKTMTPLEVFAGSDWSGPDYGDLVQKVWEENILPAFNEYIAHNTNEDPGGSIDKTPSLTPTPTPIINTEYDSIVIQPLVVVDLDGPSLTQIYKYNFPGTLINPDTGVENSQFLLTDDTGSFELLIADSIRQELGLPILSTQQITGVGGSPITANNCKVNLKLTGIKGQIYELIGLNCVAVPNYVGILFGAKALIDRGIGSIQDPIKKTLTLFQG